jgi:hypothetical protein
MPPTTTFSRWLLQGKPMATAALGAVGVILQTVLWVYPSLRESAVPWLANDPERVRITFAVVQATVLLLIVALGFFLWRPREHKRMAKSCVGAVRQFWCIWCINWAVWVVFYCMLAWRAYCVATESHNMLSIATVLTNVFNNANTVCMILLFVVLSRITANPNGTATGKFVIVVIVAVVVLAVVSLAEALCTAHHVPRKPLPAQVSTLADQLNEDGANVEQIARSLRDAAKSEQNLSSTAVFSFFIGIAASMALAMLIGRFDSKLLGTPLWIVILGFFYAAIQSGYVGFGNLFVEVGLTATAFVLKTIVFLYVAYIVDSGVLAFYMERARLAIIHRGKERRHYLLSLEVEKPQTLLEILVLERRFITPTYAWEILRGRRRAQLNDVECKELKGMAELAHIKNGGKEYVLSELIVDKSTRKSLHGSINPDTIKDWQEKTKGWKWLRGESPRLRSRA